MIILAGILNILIPLITLILVVVAVLLVLICLMQRPKNEGLGAAFGGGMTDQMFGAQTTSVLEKATVWLGIIFFTSTLALAILQTRNNTASGINTGTTTEQVEGGDLSLSEQLDKAEAEQTDSSLTEQLKEASEKAVSNAKNLGGAAVDGVKSAGEAIGDGAQAAGEGAKNLGGAAVDGVKSAGEAIGDGAQAVGEGAKNLGGAAVDGVKSAGEAIGDGAQAVGEGAKNLGGAAVDGVKSAGEAIGDGAQAVGEGAKNLGGAAVDGVKSAGEAIGDGAQAAGNAVVEGAKEIEFMTLSDNVKNFTDKLTNINASDEAALDKVYSDLSADGSSGFLYRIPFQTGETGVPTLHQEALIAKLQTASPDATLVTIGYADVRGDDALNKRLSYGRAQEVGAWIKKTLGGNTSIETFSMGETDRFSKSDYSKNRVVEVWQVAKQTSSDLKDTATPTE